MGQSLVPSRTGNNNSVTSQAVRHCLSCLLPVRCDHWLAGNRPLMLGEFKTASTEQCGVLSAAY